MNRATLDKLISTSGLIVGIVLLMAAGGLSFAHNFIHSQVHDQLAAQKITFPAAGSEGIKALSSDDAKSINKYAGQQLVTGAQAEAFANHYIAAHLEKIGEGKTYAELSSASLADPTNAALAGKVQVVFRGETLRGLLLNAYAFDTMATVANVAALCALIAGAVLLVLAALGFSHAKRADKKRR